MLDWQEKELKTEDKNQIKDESYEHLWKESDGTYMSDH